jgi:hypothetical protein
MASRKVTGSNNKLTLNRQGTNKRTSIGMSSMTRPKNKHKKSTFKKYRGQGRTR